MTCVADALAAADVGADAIGMVLHADSPRRIDRETARQIVEALPPFVTPVGLFVDAPPELVIEMTTDLNLTHVQLHGHEPPSMVASVRGRTIVKAIRVEAGRLREEVSCWRNVPHLKGLLLDTGGTAQGGGSGIENNWEVIRGHADAGDLRDLPQIILAGGLRPDNVADVVRSLRPWAVDVSSGIESAKGIKSLEKMRAFVEAVREADAS